MVDIMLLNQGPYRNEGHFKQDKSMKSQEKGEKST